jgi:hypothetical protein
MTPQAAARAGSSGRRLMRGPHTLTIVWRAGAVESAFATAVVCASTLLPFEVRT